MKFKFKLKVPQISSKYHPNIIQISQISSSQISQISPGLSRYHQISPTIPKYHQISFCIFNDVRLLQLEVAHRWTLGLVRDHGGIMLNTRADTQADSMSGTDTTGNLTGRPSESLAVCHDLHPPIFRGLSTKPPFGNDLLLGVELNCIGTVSI
jgi:hypothetical protein